MQYTILRRDREETTFSLVGEGDTHTEAGHAVVVSFYFGITVGFIYRTANGFSFWKSSNTTNLLKAWRVSTVLKHLERVRVVSGYLHTITSLVIGVGGHDHNEKRLHELTLDFGFEGVEQTRELVTEMNSTWPTQEVLVDMLNQLPDEQIDNQVGWITNAVANDQFTLTGELARIVEDSRARTIQADELKDQEDQLIEAGLPVDMSVRQLFVDLKVTNVVYSVGVGDFGEPSHFQFDDLDRELLKELIGSSGHSDYVPIYTTEKLPDDPTAHSVVGGEGIKVYASDFGEAYHPRTGYEGGMRVFAVKYDRVTRRFLIGVKPDGYEDKDKNKWCSIDDLRSMIEIDYLIGPVPVVTLETISTADSGASVPGPNSGTFDWRFQE